MKNIKAKQNIAKKEIDDIIKENGIQFVIDYIRMIYAIDNVTKNSDKTINLLNNTITTSKLEINSIGSKIYRNEKGEYHRENGPAYEYKNGNKYWYKEGKQHRLDGPAVDGESIKEWWIEGEYYTEEEFNKKMKERTNK